jgi:hypothetical protein
LAFSFNYFSIKKKNFEVPKISNDEVGAGDLNLFGIATLLKYFYPRICLLLISTAFECSNLGTNDITKPNLIRFITLTKFIFPLDKSARHLAWRAENN